MKKFRIEHAGVMHHVTGENLELALSAWARKHGGRVKVGERSTVYLSVDGEPITLQISTKLSMTRGHEHG